jgi:hypothetical protein
VRTYGSLETLRLDLGENRHESNLDSRAILPSGQGQAAVVLQGERDG